jgi:glycosyltransferase involved in cell wall biosynthesis
MRIAFLTSEYPSELPDSGGLATYVHRMARLVLQFGHEAEVFVASQNESTTIEHEGVPVHKVCWSGQPRIPRIDAGTRRWVVPGYTWHSSIKLLLQAYALAKAVERRHASNPFDLVQSADYFAMGLFVARRPGRVRAVRCSYAADLYDTINQSQSVFESVRGYLERMTMRRADICYAPSRFLADYFRRVHKFNIELIRPPIHIPTVEQTPSPPLALPKRFFIHFGMLIKRKGTDLLAEALPLAWKTAPDLTMVWSGVCWDQSNLQKWQSLWGDRATQILITGPLRRAALYSVLQESEVAVLPSQVDNLPNTVIESLSLGIPVLGSRGASIDELVEEGVSGHLVELGDVQGLARALTKMWNRKTPVSKGFKWKSEILNEMNPEAAVANLVRLCRLQAADSNNDRKLQAS